MEFAYSVDMIPNAFSPYALNGDDLLYFYDDDTMAARTGKVSDSPILDIYDRCTDPSSFNKILLLGHRGCGKSTELNHLSVSLRKSGYAVKNISCWNNLNFSQMEYTDILILLGDALLSLVSEYNCYVPDELCKAVYNFWRRDGEEIISDESEYEIDTEGGVSAETPSILNILKVFVNVKANIKQNSKKRQEYKLKIERRPNEWTNLIDQLADSIAIAMDENRPIIIFEDLDKLDTVSVDKAWEVFSTHGGQLNAYSFPIIYTFPISLSYSPKYTSVDNYFQPFILPMIKVRTIDGTPYSRGLDNIRKIIELRTKADLFDDGVMDLVIKKTGGSLRDLFSVIARASTFARRSKRSTISMEDIQSAMDKLKSELSKRIKGKEHDFLVSVYNGEGNHRMIDEDGFLLKMITANAVLEYNGQRWYDVHPLVADYLIDDLNMTTRRENDR